MVKADFLLRQLSFDDVAVDDRHGHRGRHVEPINRTVAPTGFGRAALFFMHRKERHGKMLLLAF